jgi:thiamine transport system substrate-binding protein
MKKLVFLLTFLAISVSGYGVYHYFEKFHRGRNPAAPRPELIIYTHSSFMSAYGPGPELAREFEKICLCNVRYVDAGGSQLLLEKLRLPQTVADVVLGLDQLSLKAAAQQIKWRDLKPQERNWHEVFAKNHYKFFLPYDWSPMTFLFRKGEVQNSSDLKQFLASLPEKSLSLQDPELSTPGKQLMFWSLSVPEAFSDMKSKVHSFAPDWSAAYGLFKKNQSKAVFTYLTSLVYHLDEEKDDSYEVAVFDQGHPVQIEYAAVPDTCRSCALAERFVEFLTEESSQKTLMNKNFMLPIVKGVEQGTSFAKLPELKLLPPDQLDTFVDQQEDLLKAWTLKFGQ